MKGFVPVTKASLLAMVAECRLEITHQEVIAIDKSVNDWIKSEEIRSTTRHWYRLFLLPKARFAYDRASVIAYSSSLQYGMFDGCAFRSIEDDVKNSNKVLDKFERLATSEYSGEPILLGADDFSRLSSPERHWWVRSGIHYSCI